MKTYKRIVCWLFGLVIAASAVMCIPIETEATATKSTASIVLCASFDSDGEIVELVPGIPIVMQTNQVMLTGAGMNTSNDLV